MHPEFKQIGPGSCPICGMALEPEQVSLNHACQRAAAGADGPELAQPDGVHEIVIRGSRGAGPRGAKKSRAR
jgi:hypothetical protein